MKQLFQGPDLISMILAMSELLDKCNIYQTIQWRRQMWGLNYYSSVASRDIDLILLFLRNKFILHEEDIIGQLTVNPSSSVWRNRKVNKRKQKFVLSLANVCPSFGSKMSKMKRFGEFWVTRRCSASIGKNLVEILLQFHQNLTKNIRCKVLLILIITDIFST